MGWEGGVKILVTGASGQFARLVVDLLAEQHELIGADVRPQPRGRKFPGDFTQLRYTQRRMADLFRKAKPDVLLHLGRIRSTSIDFDKRFDQNVLGTRNLLELSLKHGVRRVVVLSTYHVYGAHQHNHVHIGEDAPLRASQTFPELADAVELDHSATTFLWRYRDVETVVLRPANVVGPDLKNMMSRLLRNPRVPMLLGYDPMMQFLHEEDAASAVQLAVEGSQWGVFNIAGEGAIPYSEAIRLAGASALPIPHFVAYPIVGLLDRWGLHFPRHLVDYFRFPTVIDDRLFREAFAYQPQYSIVETIRSLQDV